MPPSLAPVLTITYVCILHHETVPFCKTHVWGSCLEANVFEIQKQLKSYRKLLETLDLFRLKQCFLKQYECTALSVFLQIVLYRQALM